MNISAKQVAELLGVPLWWVHRWATTPTLPLKVNYTKSGYRKYDLGSVMALAEKWADDKEKEAAVIRDRITKKSAVQISW